MSFLPFLTSFILGYLLLTIFFKDEPDPGIELKSFLAAGLGLGLSSHIVFYSFLLFQHLNKPLIVFVHLLILGAFLGYHLRRFVWLPQRQRLSIRVPFKELRFIPALIVLALPLWFATQLYPLGGWDAWAVWNFKARFLLLGGEMWRNVFDPAVWRSSPHYPLLLPLINVWGWLAGPTAPHIIPATTALIFTVATAGLLTSGLKSTGVKNIGAYGPAVLILTAPFFLKLAAGQYADIVIGYYLLGTFVCLISAQIKKSGTFAGLAGLFCGFLSFSKVEGTTAAALLAILGWILLKEKILRNRYAVGLLIGALPTLFFFAVYSPGNQTFINGLFSESHPAHLNRLLMIGLAYPLELISAKWNGLWLCAVAGMIVAGKSLWEKSLRIIPFFLIAYLLFVSAYYFINTRFEIVWFLTSSLNRILFSLLPTILFWVFLALSQAGIFTGRSAKDAES